MVKNKKTSLGDITKNFGKQQEIAVTNLNGNVILSAEEGTLRENTLIVSSPISTNLTDIGIHSMFMTDGDGKAVRLTYTIEPGNGLVVGRNGVKATSSNTDDYDVVSLSIDNYSIETHDNGQLYVNPEHIIDSYTLMEYNEEDKDGVVRDYIQVITKNLDHATDTTYGIAKGDERTIDTDNGLLTVITPGLDRVDTNSNTLGIVVPAKLGTNPTIYASNGVLDVITTNLDVATSGSIGVVKPDNTYTFVDGKGVLTVSNYTYAVMEKVTDAKTELKVIGDEEFYIEEKPTYRYTYGLIRPDGTTTQISEKEPGKLYVNTQGLTRGNQYRYGVVKTDNKSIESNSGVISVKDYEYIIATINEYNTKIVEITNSIVDLTNRISVIENKFKDRITVVKVKKSKTILSLPKVDKTQKQDVWYLATSEIESASVELQVTSNCQFNLSVSFENNEMPAMSVEQIYYDGQLKQSGSSTTWQFDSTDNKQKSIKISFTASNFNNKTVVDKFINTKAIIKLSAISDSTISQEVVHLFHRWNEWAFKEPITTTVENDFGIENATSLKYLAYNLSFNLSYDPEINPDYDSEFTCVFNNDVYRFEKETFDIPLTFECTYLKRYFDQPAGADPYLFGDDEYTITDTEFIIGDQEWDITTNTAKNAVEYLTTQKEMGLIKSERGRANIEPVMFSDDTRNIGYIEMEIEYDTNISIDANEYRVIDAFNAEDKSIIVDNGFETKHGVIGDITVWGEKVLRFSDLSIDTNSNGKPAVYYTTTDDKVKLLGDTNGINSLKLVDTKTSEVYAVGIETLKKVIPDNKYATLDTNNKVSNILYDDVTNTVTVSNEIQKTDMGTIDNPDTKNYVNTIVFDNKFLNPDYNKVEANLDYSIANRGGVIVKDNAGNVLNTTTAFTDLYATNWLTAKLKNTTSKIPILELCATKPIGTTNRSAKITLNAPNAIVDNDDKRILSFIYKETPVVRKPKINVVATLSSTSPALTFTAIRNEDVIFIDNKTYTWTVKVWYKLLYLNTDKEKTQEQCVELTTSGLDNYTITKVIYDTKPGDNTNNLYGIEITKVDTLSFNPKPYEITYNTVGIWKTNTKDEQYKFGDASISNITIEPWSTTEMYINFSIIPGPKTNLINGMKLDVIDKPKLLFTNNTLTKSFEEFYNNWSYSVTPWNCGTGSDVTIKVYTSASYSSGTTGVSGSTGVKQPDLEFNMFRFLLTLQGYYEESDNEGNTIIVYSDIFETSKTGISNPVGSNILRTKLTGFVANTEIINANYIDITSTSAANDDAKNRKEWVKTINDLKDAINNLNASNELNNAILDITGGNTSGTSNSNNNTTTLTPSGSTGTNNTNSSGTRQHTTSSGGSGWGGGGARPPQSGSTGIGTGGIGY